jgi:hypothetical protein
MKQAQDQMAAANVKPTFDVTVKNTGVTKVVNGLQAQEQLITMTMHFTVANPATAPGAPAAPAAPPSQPVAAPDPSASMAYTMTTDIWIAPDPPEVKEIHDFELRMAKKMMEGVDLSAMMASWKQNSNMGMAQMFAGHPGASEAMEQMHKEMAKLQGTHVMEVMSMGGSGTGMAQPVGAPPAGPSNIPVQQPPAQNGSVVGQVATDTATQTAAGETSKLGIVGSALGSSVLGAFHRKKAQQQQQQQAQAQQQAPPAAAAPAANGTAAPVSAVLMEMTTQESNFSSEPVPVSVFQVPAGFKQVPSAWEKMNK